MSPFSKSLPFLLLASASPALAQQSATLIKDVLVFDGENAAGEGSVLIVDDRIADINLKGKPPKDAIVIDGKGKMLMPGMIDAHVHAMQGLDTALLFGVTTQLDIFPPAFVFAFASALVCGGVNISSCVVTPNSRAVSSPCIAWTCASIMPGISI